MTVTIVGWSDDSMLAFVDEVRVRIRVNRARTVTRWLCDAHGDRTEMGHCAHTQKLADTPAPPEKRNRS